MGDKVNLKLIKTKAESYNRKAKGKKTRKKPRVTVCDYVMLLVLNFLTKPTCHFKEAVDSQKSLLLQDKSGKKWQSAFHR